jgi:hypothetical protein
MVSDDCVGFTQSFAFLGRRTKNDLRRCSARRAIAGLLTTPHEWGLSRIYPALLWSPAIHGRGQ